ncbi:MAG: tRNA lysidine(34) synthetase TilS [Bacteroidaceae bacterium]
METALKVAHFIEQKQLLSHKNSVLVAVSGGADSMALLRILVELGYSVEAMHCNFHLRGEESDRDDLFVQTECEKLAIPVHRTDFDTSAYATTHKISIEMAARDLRYNYFKTLLKEGNERFQAIAVAHHRNDVAETVLLNLLRGTGIAGFHGIRAIHDSIVRPLLCLSRSEILNYLTQIGQDFRTDSSNLTEEYTRNKIRLSVLPLLETLNPNIYESLNQTADNIAEAEKVYQRGIEDGKKQITTEQTNTQFCFSIPALLAEPSPKALLHEIVSGYGFTPSQEEDLLNSLKGESGKKFESENWSILKDRTELILFSKEALLEVSKPKLLCEIYLRTELKEIPRTPTIACIDIDQLPSSLITEIEKRNTSKSIKTIADLFCIRLCERGDRFQPLGMKGFKLISDFLTDRKKTLLEKQQQLVLTLPEQLGGNILWIINERMDHHFRITEKTHRILCISLLQKKEIKRK